MQASLAKMIELLSSFSEGRSRNEDERLDGRVDVDVVSTQSLRISSLCDAAEDIALRNEVAVTQKPRALATRTKHQSEAKQVRGTDSIDETSWCDEDGSDQVVVQADVLNTRAVKVWHYVMIDSRPHRVEKILGTQEVWRGPETGCFKTHFVARCFLRAPMSCNSRCSHRFCSKLRVHSNGHRQRGRACIAHINAR